MQNSANPRGQLRPWNSPVFGPRPRLGSRAYFATIVEEASLTMSITNRNCKQVRSFLSLCHTCIRSTFVSLSPVVFFLSLSIYICIHNILSQLLVNVRDDIIALIVQNSVALKKCNRFVEKSDWSRG